MLDADRFDPDLDAVVGSGLRSYAEALSVPAATVDDVSQRWRRRRRRRIGSGVLAVVAVVAVSVASAASLREPQAADRIDTVDADRPSVSTTIEALSDTGQHLAGGAEWNGELWAVRPRDPSGGPALYRSEDGVHWSEVTVPAGTTQVHDVTGAGDRLVLVGADRSGTFAATTDDGQDWRVEPVTTVGEEDASGVAAEVFAANDRLFVVVTEAAPAVAAFERITDEVQQVAFERFGTTDIGVTENSDGTVTLSVGEEPELLFSGAPEELGLDTEEVRQLVGFQGLEGAETEPTRRLFVRDGGWVERPMPAGYVVSESEIGVVVVDDETTRFTDDGLTWTNVDLPTSAQGEISEITERRGEFLAVAAGGVIRASRPEGPYTSLIPFGSDHWFEIGSSAIAELSEATEPFGRTMTVTLHTLDGTAAQRLELELHDPRSVGIRDMPDGSFLVLVTSRGTDESTVHRIRPADG